MTSLHSAAAALAFSLAGPRGNGAGRTMTGSALAKRARDGGAKPTPPEILARNAADDRPPTRKQILYLERKTEAHGFTSADLIAAAIELRRLLPLPADRPRNPNPLLQLTRREVGGLFEIVHALGTAGSRAPRG